MRMVSLGEGQPLSMKTGTGYLRAGAQKGMIHAKGSVTQHPRMLRLVPAQGCVGIALVTVGMQPTVGMLGRKASPTE